MAAVINTNISSLNAQRNLATSQGELAVSLQRLSSGLRINSAKDDAAGLAISERMTTQIRGSNQAVRNANDGVSLAQTAEGGLGSISDSLQRIRELAVQSANATNSASDRAALNVEAQQLKDEIDRVSSQTSFNGVNLLDGSFLSQQFQVGANAGETIAVASIVNAQSTDLGDNTLAEVTSTVANTTALTAASFSVNGTFILTDTAAAATTADNAERIRVAINEQSGTTGVYATLDAATGLDLSLTSDGTITLAGDAAGLVTTGATAAATATAAVTGFQNLDISSVGGANVAIQTMDSALNSVNTARANLGALQSRFVSVVANLAINSENLSAARSRIRDADFAAETASLTRAQILQQAGTAMLSQANSLPQNVLSLLG
jgi:flagellin